MDVHLDPTLAGNPWCSSMIIILKPSTTKLINSQTNPSTTPKPIKPFFFKTTPCRVIKKIIQANPINSKPIPKYFWVFHAVTKLPTQAGAISQPRSMTTIFSARCTAARRRSCATISESRWAISHHLWGVQNGSQLVGVNFGFTFYVNSLNEGGQGTSRFQ